MSVLSRTIAGLGFEPRSRGYEPRKATTPLPRIVHDFDLLFIETYLNLMGKISESHAYRFKEFQ